MKKVAQQSFEDLGKAPGIVDHPLVVHQRTGRPDNHKLIVFAYGLGGHRYGKSSTWGNFPKFLLDEFAHVDVGLYAYRTLFARLVFWKSIELEDEAQIFASELRDDSQYETILLIGHSMGGLLLKAAVKYLIDSNQRPVVNRIKALILMAVPQAGSMRVLPFLDWFSSDFYALKPHGKFVASVNQSFLDHVSVLRNDVPHGKIHLPTHAVRAGSDFWVDRLSAGMNLPSEQMKPVHGSHTSFVKPKTTDDAGYKYVRGLVAEFFPPLPAAPPLLPAVPHARAAEPVRQRASRNFTGRLALLDKLDQTLAAHQPAAVWGIGGVGKSQLAARYAELHADKYKLVWWLPCELTEAIPGHLQALAAHLDLPEKEDKDPQEAVHAVWNMLKDRTDWLMVLTM